MKRNSRLKGIALLLTAALLTGGCGGEAAPEGTAPAAAVKAVSPEIGTLTVSNQFVGTVSPQQQVSVIPLVSGVIDALYADVGDEVSAGQVLFHIEDDAAKLQAESAAASKKSAEASAKMQLGSAQVMNNISMESNIRSIEFQIESARDQYNSAANSVEDAQNARDDMKDALHEINDSLDGLQDSYGQMRNVISQAKNCVYKDAEGSWAFRTVYSYPLPPDQYNWSQAGSTDPKGDDKKNGGETPHNDLLPVDSHEDETPSGETQSGEITENETTNNQKPSNGTSDHETSSDEASENETLSDETSAPVETAEEPEGTQDGSQARRRPDGRYGYDAAGQPQAYFSVEIIREDPVYLAAAVSEPKDEFATVEEAWAAYAEQQKINALKKAVGEMGYGAADIGDGTANKDLERYASRIENMQTQAAQLKSNQASMDSNIDSAETAKSTTQKTIDFYQDNLKDAQTTYGIQNGQAYQDTADALAAQIAAADVGVKSAQLQLEYYSPSAPISGTVISKGVELYGMAQPGYAAYVISNQDAMNVTFMVSGQVRNSLMEGMPVTLEKDGETFQGTITEIGESVDAQSGGMFTVKAITEVGGDTLANGAAVKLTVDTFRSDNAVLIPYDAIHFESEKAYVFRIIDGKAVRTAVSVGLMNDDMAEVTEGLAADAKVIATWSSQLEDGAAVRVIGEEGAAE